MSFRPAPLFIRKTDEEIRIEREKAGPGGQVSPLKPNPELYASYQILQDGNEVGWVYVRGSSGTDCTETWLLYKSTVTGAGLALPGSTAAITRAAYTWPSEENLDVSLRLIYRGRSDTATGPSDLTGSHPWDAINARVA